MLGGAVAGAYYGVPDDIRAKAETFLDGHLLKALPDFERIFVSDFAAGGESVIERGGREKEYYLDCARRVGRWRLPKSCALFCAVRKTFKN